MNPESAEAHVTPYRTYVLVWISLVILTGVTVTVASLNLGLASILVALAIAGTKSSLVLAQFMHLKNERGVFKILIPLAIVILVLFIGLTFTDVAFR